jgi:nicotinate-nucleotide--dimethylbenzimidazole phosphoribosyltransferase
VKLLEETLRAIRPRDDEARRRARSRLEELTMPYWALGRLMDLAEDLAGITGVAHPPTARRTVVVMAGDHGVAAEGVSKYPAEVTVQMVLNFVRGGAAANAMARVVGARVVVVDMGVAGELPAEAAAVVLHRRVAAGTGNIARGPAMTREQAIQALEAGIGIAADLEGTTDLFATGEMGIANTTPSSAIVAALCGCSPAEATGAGTGIDEPQRLNKIAVVERALAVNRPDPNDGLDVLARVGGFEIAGLAGLILGAAARRKPVLIDGFISTAAALIAQALAPASADAMIAAHQSVEPGHRAALAKLGKRPLLDLGMRLGEGTGATLAMGLVEAAARLLSDVATFEEAAVSQANQPAAPAVP